MKGIRKHLVAIASCVIVLDSLVRSQDGSSNDCPKGTIKTGPQCIPCPRNKYSDEKGASKCIDCPLGFITSSAGSTSLRDCEPCPPGKFFKNGTCGNNCPIDTYGNKEEGATSCIPCPPGTVSPQKTSSKSGCKSCPIGLVTVRGQFIRCEVCPAGKSTTSETSFNCEDCPIGTFQSEDRRRLGGGKCQPCRPGSFADKKGTARCKPCPNGFYQNDSGATSCKKCPKRSTTAGERGKSCRPTCLPSEPGCIYCPPGEGYNADKEKCEKCPNGFISATASSTECYPCPEGDGKSNELRTKCVCKRGYRLKRDGTCEECPQRYTSTDGATCICITTGKRTGPCECPEGQEFDYYKNKCVNLKDPIECPDGSVLLFSGECKKCPGDSIPNEDQTACTCDAKGKGVQKGKCVLCPPGEVAGSVSGGNRPSVAKCFKCIAPQFNDEAGAVGCKNCPKGQKPSRDGATACLPPCPPGAERENYFFRNGDDECRCKSGSAPSGSGVNLTCTKCKRGEVVFKGKCVCPSGVFVGPGNEECAKCPTKAYVWRGKCSCDSGFAKNRQTGECEPCPRGTFSDSSTKQKCEPCPPGEVTTEKGESYCRNCGMGFVPFQGIKCLPQCAKGYFRNKDEMCVKCAKGQRIVDLKCEDCPRNSVSGGGLTTKCTRCGDGKAPNSEKDKCVAA